MSLFSPKVKLFLILLLVVGIFFGIFWFSGKEDRLFAAVPNDIAVVVELDSWDSFRKNYASYLPESVQVFKGLETTKTIEADYENLIHYAEEDDKLRASLQQKSMAIGLSLHPSDANHPIFIVDRPDGFVLQAWLDQLILTGRKVKQYHNNGHILHEISDQKGKKICVGQSGNLLIFSQLSWMIEESLALASLGVEKAWTSSFYRSSKKVHDSEHLRLYLSGDACGKRLQEWLRPEYQFVASALQSTLSSMAVQITEKGALVLLESPNQTAAADIIKQSNASSTTPIESILPDNTSISLQMNWKPKQWKQLLFSGKDAGNFHQFLQAWSNYQLAVAIGEPLSGDISEDCMMAFGVQDEKALLKNLESMGKSTDYQSFKVFELPEAGPFKAIFQKMHNDPKHISPSLYGTVLGKWLVVTWQPSAIEIIIDKYIVGQTLAQSTNFLLARAKSTSQEPIALTLMWNNKQLPNILDAVYQEPISGAARKAMRQSGWMNLQKKEIKGSVSHWVAGIQQGNTQDQTPQYVWKTPFEAELVGMPQVVALSDTSYVILVQDVLHKLHCTNTNGELLWTKALDGPLLSNVTTMMPYMEGKPALLCNTAGNVYLFEWQEGESVGGYPIQLRSKASNGLLPVYFEGSKQYAFFMANENGYLFGYDHLGRPLEGWNGQHNPGKVSRPMVHYRYDDKDYIVAVNDQGIISTFGKYGEERLPSIASEVVPNGIIQVDKSGAIPRIVFSDAVGVTVVGNAKGEVFRMPFNHASTPLPTEVVLTNYSGDERLDYSILQAKSLQIRAYQANNTLKTVLKHQFTEEQDGVFVPNNIAQGAGIIGTRSSGVKQITMLKKGRGIMNGFPLAGTTPFALLPVQQDKYLLIVGDGTSLNAYRILR